MKYQVKLSPVNKRNQSRVSIHLIRILGRGAESLVEELVKNGGVVRDNLIKKEADRIAAQLRNLGATVEVSQVASDEPEKGYRLKLISSGDRKIAVIKEVREITGLGLKESKQLVDNLGVIGVFEDEKDAYAGKERLEAAGAKAVVEQIQDSEPEPEPKPEEPSPQPEPNPGPGPQPDSKKSNTVYGRVTDSNKRPLQNLEVEIYDVDMRHWYPLANTLTDQDGKYQLKWTQNQLNEREYKTADIAVRVFTVERGSLLFETSIKDVRFNASDREEINITIRKPLPKEEIEFDLLVRKVKFLAGSVNITELQENKEHQDVTFLSKELDIVTDKIEHLIVAHRLQRKSDINAGFFYALFSTDALLTHDFSKKLHSRIDIGINSDDQTLLYDAALADSEVIKSAINKAVEDKVVSASEIENLNQNLKKLSKYRRKASDYYKHEHPKNVIGRFTNFFKEDKLGEIKDSFNTNRDNLDSFFEQISDPSFFKSESHEGDAKTNIELGKLFGFGEEVIPKIARNKGFTKPGDIRKLARLNKTDWEKEITKVNPSLKNKKLISSYASGIVRKMENEFPTVAFAAQLERSKKTELNNQKAIISFFKKHEDFDLQQHNVDLYLKEKKVANKEVRAISEELKSVQRVFKLVPNYSKILALRDQNIHSSLSIVSLGVSRFTREVAPKAGISESEAREIFRKAEAKHTAAMLVSGNLQDSVSGEGIAALKNSSLSKKLKAVSEDFPNLKSLFKLTDTCECKHCRSVYSPAAYLVEILQFVEKRAVVSGNAKSVLFDRRPDLGEIDLGCANANTPVPYIDLVCEILEDAISPDQGIDYQGELYNEPGSNERIITDDLRVALTTAGLPVTENAQIFGTEARPNTSENDTPSIIPPYYLRDEKVVCKIIQEAENQYKVFRLRQTLSTAVELDAAPEYINQNAYQELRDNSFAFNLPFDLPHTEAKAYLSRFGIDRADLMRAFQSITVPSDENVAAEKLGLTDTERKLITSKPNPNNNGAQQAIWKTPSQWNETDSSGDVVTISGSVIDYLKRADHFLQRTGLTYKELDLLLKLKFIDKNKNLFVQHNDLSCNTEQKEIVNLNLDALDRIHRFLRLQKMTGWSYQVLDEIISQSNLGGGHLDDDCLIKAAQLKNISEKTKIKIEELTGFFGEIPHAALQGDGATPLYHQIYLNKAKNGIVEEGLLPENVDGTDQLSAYADYIATCLHLKKSELDRIIDLLPDKNLSFSNLSYLLAASRLMKTLGLDVKEFSLLIELSKLELKNPEDLLEFLKVYETFQLSPLPVEDVKFLLNHEALKLEEIVIPDSKIVEILEELQAGYQKIISELKSPIDESLLAEEQLDTLKSILNGLTGIEEADIKTIIKFFDGDWSDVSNANGAKAFIDNILPDTVKTSEIHSAIEELDALDSDAENQVQQLALLQAFMDAIAAFQIKNAKQELLKQTLADHFKTEPVLAGQILQLAILKQMGPDPESIVDLLTVDFDDDTISRTKYPEQFASIHLVQKLVLFLDAFDFSESEVKWYFTYNSNSSLNWLEFDAIPYSTGQNSIDFDKYLNFIRLVQMSNTFSAVVNPEDIEHPIDFFTVAMIIAEGDEAERDQFLKKLSLLTGHSQDILGAIDKHLFASFDITKYADHDNLNRILECADFTRKLGASVEQINGYIKPILSSSEVSDLRKALKTRYDEDTWLRTLKEIMDMIRPQKRDALVAYLLATQPEMKDKNDLYDYFLVDVEMEACMPSSRIVQAHQSVQLFVQRCMMGLETDAIADLDKDPNWNQWKWMKNYRVWEANRKVFLYPENWYDVTLSDDKSYLLEELISEIQQNELTNDTAELALRKYLEKLDKIAFLEVMATWYDVPNRTMHVFARTKGGDPATYYYRKFEKERYWTPWKKVELDITGDHLLAFMRNNRLHLAWPVFSEEVKPDQKTKVPSASDQGEYIAQDKPDKKLKIQLAISEYSNHQWQPKKISKDGIKAPNGWYKENPKELKEQCVLKYMSLPEDIFTGNNFSSPDQIWLFNRHGKGEVLGIFDIAGCKGYPEVLDYDSVVIEKSPVKYLIVNYLKSLVNNASILPQLFNTKIINQKYVEGKEGIGLYVKNIPSILNSSNHFPGLLYNTPDTFRITYPHQLTILDLISVLMLGVMNSSGNSLTLGVGRNINIPFGTLLPYFKEDNDHAYVIIPGFYHQGTPRIGEALTDSGKRTASNVYQLIDDMINWYKKIQADLENNPSPPETMTEIIDFILKDSDFQKLLNELSTYANLDVFTNFLIGLSEDAEVTDLLEGMTKEKPLAYGEQFKNMYHPMVCALRSRLYKGGIPALMKRETQLLESNFDFQTHYKPNPYIVAKSGTKKEDGSSVFSYPIEDIDFESDGSYSAYNWDLFYRVPLHIATNLTKNQRFEEAMDWFHYMFNPTGALPGEGVQKYWVTKPFYLNQVTDYIDQRIDSVMYDTADTTNSAIKELEFAVSEWRNKPFKPDVIARFRPVAYQKTLLMKYIDNLTEWGDNLFRQDTMESIAQATQMYILADKLLGPKPRIIPAAIKQPYETYNQLKGKIDSFGNALIELENILPDFSVLSEGGDELPAPPPDTLSMLYFCVPPNEKMSEYWDRIADRLFKIRHCQNIDGVERNLALFAPPIDPGMLVKAASSGLDLSTILAGFNAPLPHYRFNVLSQKATELAQEVRGLGNALLQALEKKDGEAIALLRSDLELKVLNAVTDTKKLQVDEAKEQIEVLKRTKKVTEERHTYYKEIEYMNALEITSLTMNGVSLAAYTVGSIMEMTAGATRLIPDVTMGASGFGGSPVVTAHTVGGEKISESTSSFAKALILGSQVIDKIAGGISTMANYQRRNDDWKLQERVAEKEINSIDKQIEAAEIRKEIAENDFASHELQIENAKKTDDFMHSKFTNKELYDWMIGQISAVYFKSYQLAHDFAKKAERCYRFELGNDDSYISYGYWDSMKKGLQSADNLIHDIKRMETSYLDKNKREYEITKHISVAQLDPLALVRLRETGICDFEIPEVLFDMDHPGQYFRRIKSVSISVPCVAGPHTPVSAKLSLIKNKYRKNINNPENYIEDTENDSRFMYNIGAIQSIATSHGQNDSGVFELNFRDERYLPFENTGAISSWRLELPTEIRQFDYNTITDVILHVKYTAREGGSILKEQANKALSEQLNSIKQGLENDGLHLALNLKHDLANQWHQLKQKGEVDLTIDKSSLPYFVKSIENIEISKVMFLARTKEDSDVFSLIVNENEIPMAKINEKIELLNGSGPGILLNTPFKVSINSEAGKLEDLILILKYTVTEEDNQ